MVYPRSEMRIEDVPIAAVDTMLVPFYVEALERFRDHTIKRLVRALDGIGAEWEREEKRLRSLGADEEFIAEVHADLSLTAIHVEQETRNILAVSLYHLFEKQVTRFARSVVGRREKNPKTIRNLKAVAKELAKKGMDCRDFACLQKIEVLRVVANTIKHGKDKYGKEREKDKDLDKIPREFFCDPARVGDEVGEHESTDFDLYVHRHHLDEWCIALLEFWSQMSELCWSQKHVTLGSLVQAASEPDS